METVDPTENAYVAVIGRKTRNLRKKLDKIMKVDAQQKEGKKPLNEEQLVLLTNRGTVEKALNDMEAIKAQLEEIAKEDMINRQLEMAQMEAALAEAKASIQTVEASTHTQSQDQSNNATQYEKVAPAEENHVACGPDNAQTESSSVDQAAAFQELLKSNIYKLLKLFHVCARYSDLTGNSLPADIVYFGKCLMGETSISGFKETLQQSARNAELYLDEEMGSKYEAIRGMSYIQISDIIDSLAAEFEVPPPPPPVQSPPVQSPQINFFADADEVALDSSIPADSSSTDNFSDLQGISDALSSPFPLPPSAVGMENASAWTSTLGAMGSSALSETPEVVAVAPPAVPSSEMDPVHVPEENSSGSAGRKASAPGGQKGRGNGRNRTRSKGNKADGEKTAAAPTPAVSVEKKAAAVAVAAPMQTAPSEQTKSPAPAASAAPRGKAWGAGSKAGGALAVAQGEAPVKPVAAPGKPKPSGARKPSGGAKPAPVEGERPPRREGQGAPGGPKKTGPPRRPPAANGAGGRGAGRGNGAAGKPASVGKPQPRESKPPRDRAPANK